MTESTADALRRGDEYAFEELYVQLRGDVYNLAARIVGDRREAEDIAQEVFLRAYRHLPGKADQRHPEAWVFRTTVNACCDHLRRRTPAPVDTQDGRETVAGDTYAQAATAAAVEETLGRIEPRYRTALVLKDLHGLGNGEIAEIMGVARGTVGVLLFRARTAFKKRYREVAPTLGAGLPAAGIAIWLPPLSLPASLATPPDFLAPLAGPLSSLPLASSSLAPAAAPVAAGLAKLAGALTTKTAVVAIAATAVTGGGIVAYETHDAQGPAPSHMAAVAQAHHEGSNAPSQAGAEAHAKTHAALAAGTHQGDHTGDAAHTGDHGAGGAGTGDGVHGYDGTRAGDGTHAGETEHTGDGWGATSGSGDGGAAEGGTSHGGGGAHADDGDGTHAEDGGETEGSRDGEGPGGSGAHAGSGTP